MKVSFPLINTFSGYRTWTLQLAEELKSWGVEASVKEYPNLCQYSPGLIRVKEKADVIHANSWNAYAFKGDAPMVVTEHLLVHDDTFTAYKSAAQKVFHKRVYAFERKSFENADQVTSVSEYTSSKLKEAFNVASTVILNGVDTAEFYPYKSLECIKKFNDKIKLLFVGNMSLRKGKDVLFGVMNELGDDFVLVCVSGRDRKFKQLSPNIYSIGCIPHKEMPDYYNWCDIVFFPSRLEGLSLTLLEAMACGKPVTAFGLSSIPEVIVNEKGGFLCAEHETGLFPGKIRTLAGDTGLRQRMGDFNRTRACERFLLKHMVEKYLKIYEDLVK